MIGVGTRGVSLAFILAVSLVAGAADSLETIKVFDAEGDAARFAAVAKLGPLVEEQDEVRLWAQGSLTGSVTGWVVTNSEIRIYTNTREVNGSQIVDDEYLRLESKIVDKTTSARVLQRLTQLANLENKKIACGLDGTGYAVVGMSAGHHFSAYASNPSFCASSSAKLFSNAVSLLVKLHKSAPKTR